MHIDLSVALQSQIDCFYLFHSFVHLVSSTATSRVCTGTGFFSRLVVAVSNLNLLLSILIPSDSPSFLVVCLCEAIS